MVVTNVILPLRIFLKLQLFVFVKPVRFLKSDRFVIEYLSKWMCKFN